MAAKIIDGKALARTVREKCRLRVNALLKEGRRPALAVMLVWRAVFPWRLDTVVVLVQ